MAEPKKETVRIALPPRPDQSPSPSNGGQRDTARIVLPSRTPVAPLRRLPPKIAPLPSSDSPAEPPTVSLRRPPIAPPVSPAASPLLQPLPKPPGPEIGEESSAVPPARDEVAFQGDSAPSIHPGPKKETARISVLPKPSPAPAPAVNMTKTQPLLIRPAASVVQSVPVVISSKPYDPIAAIPKSYCWGLFGIAALIFLIQIWNFLVS
jgi:hypothetical protein